MSPDPAYLLLVQAPRRCEAEISGREAIAGRCPADHSAGLVRV
jgi:hypothetical protein